MQTLDIISPDDWHCHLRDDAFLARTVSDAAEQFQRVVVMPNCVPPITNVALAKAYQDRIQQHIPVNSSFTPLMILYLTDETTPDTIVAAKKSGFILGCKLYPAGVTTNSDQGVTSLEKIYPTLEAMSNQGLPLLIHGEVNDANVDVFDREKVFIERHLSPLLARFPQLNMVFEHITTQDAVQFVLAAPMNVAATITPHHLRCNRNAMLAGGIRPHYYCLPILKRENHQAALIQAAISGNPKFFIGTDSAPHVQAKKETSCGCAGIYNMPLALAVYATLFEEYQALDKLEGFTSRFGPQFYQLPMNTTQCRLRKQEWTVPDTLSFGEAQVIPFLAGETLNWKKI